ncbi:hypothetical protein D9756_008487 [Leucocoprinus leucothites]|uniref:Uncharacterized protein n=1 Tax=Leucocoprinus leucothites TaxID=201217 RepID=A0A8H5D0T8_9AGAR|nr:hypothetical protein D9756_008487 [Leucoagaricus leucothites]
MIFSPKIWQEIIAFYGIGSDKLHPLLSLTTVSKAISHLALDRLWQDVDTLELLKHVINAQAPSPDMPIVTELVKADSIREGRYEERWVLLSPFNEDLKSRVRDYLSRIHSLKYSITSSSCRKESSFWRILSLCTSSNTSLLPNLQSLHLSHTSQRREVIDVSLLLPILSPSIQAIDIEDGKHDHSCINVRVLLNILWSCGCKPRKINIRAHPQPDTIQSITIFPQLTALTFIPSPVPGLRNSSISVSDTLASLPHLDYLMLNLQAYTPLQPPEAITHKYLKTTCLVGEPQDYEMFFRACRLPSLHSISVMLHNPIAIRWKSFFDGIAECCPALMEIRVVTLRLENAKSLCSDDIRSIFKLPLKVFKLKNITFEFSAQEFDFMLSQWPKLRLLMFQYTTPRDSSSQKVPTYNATPLLPTIAKHSSLSGVVMGMDFQSLLDPGLLKGIVNFTSHSPLGILGIDVAANFPEELVEMYILARNLLAIFPSLCVCYLGDDEGGGEGLKKRFIELQRLIDLLKNEKVPSMEQG